MTRSSTVRVVPADGAEEGRVVVGAPGHYAEPTFTPDGATILYRRVSGGGLVSPYFSDDTGVYTVPADGGASGGEPTELKMSGGSGFHFGARSDRVYFMRGGALHSIGLDGHDEREHLSGEYVSDIRVSPDEAWVFWKHRFQAYLRPFVPTGSPASLGPGSRAVPQTQVTEHAGDFLHWSGDSERIHWALGPELHALEVAGAFDGADAPGEGIDLGFSHPADRPEGVIAFEGARIITMEGDQVIERGTLVVEGNRIVAVGEAGAVEVPPGAHRVDASGHTIMPGLVDVHQHGGQGSGAIIPEQNRANYATLAFGVTTVHNPSASTQQIFAASEMARAGEVVAPRIFSTGTILYGAMSGSTAEVNSLDDARSHISRLQAVGAFSVKSYNQPRRDQRQQILAAAREQDVMVVLEGGALFQHNMNMIQDGHTGIEHSLPLAAVYDDVLQFWAGSAAGYTPTLVVAFGPIWGENYFYYHDNVWENERLQGFTPPLQLEARSRRVTAVPANEWGHVQTAEVARDLLRQGVLVNLGAHGQLNGLDAHWELRSFGLGGMTPHEALRVATLNGATYLGLEHEIGSLTEGKLADLIVLEGNPLEDLANAERIRWTMVNGRLFDARTMDEVGNHPRPRAPFWWEAEWRDGWRSGWGAAGR
jgi:imidazolonepropionase-like amidohydrolase